MEEPDLDLSAFMRRCIQRRAAAKQRPSARSRYPDKDEITEVSHQSVTFSQSFASEAP